MSTVRAAEAAPFLTFDDLQARLCGASRSFIYSKIAAGELPRPAKIGGKSLWPRETIVAFERRLIDESIQSAPALA
jgi:predicted DNA-binding transcriptional regulator AlpA